MKKLWKLLCLFSVLLLTVACIAACGKWEDTYAALDKEGRSVSVRFDVGEGVFANTNDVYIVDVFSLDDMKTDSSGNKYAYLLSPDDSTRGQGAFEVSNTGYFLAGWYQERAPRVNEKGEALDEYGQLCSESGKEQGYTYAKRWDFSQPMTVDPKGEYSAGENYLTLYAAWIPYFEFEFYAVDADGASVKLGDAVSSIELALPEWDETTGDLNMKKFPEREGMTFEAAYLDAAMTQPAPEKITGNWDLETGTFTKTETIKLYTTWIDGKWFRIYNAEQFKNRSRLNGNYILCADLDFTNVVWSSTLAQGEFTGKIIGNNHTISGIKVTQVDRADKELTYFGGIFGSISATAEIRDVTFKDVTYEILAGSRAQGVSFGLLAGTVSNGAVFENLSVSGQLVLNTLNLPANYSLGLIFGQGDASGIDNANVTVTTGENAANATVEPDYENGEVSVTIGA